jgi:hypothetical protein
MKSSANKPESQMYVMGVDGSLAPCNDVVEWSAFVTSIWRDERRPEVVGDVEVGTYFIAFDLRRDDEPEGPPLLWETWAIRRRDTRRADTLSYVRHASEEAARSWHCQAVGYLLSQHRSGAALSDFQLKVNLRLELYLRGTREASLPLPGSSPGGRRQWYPKYAGPDGLPMVPPAADDGPPPVDS